MQQPMDYAYHALLWKKPSERYSFLEDTCPQSMLGEALEMIFTIPYPKLYNSNLAKYALFSCDELIGFFNTRDEAHHAADESCTHVVDVPIVEIDSPSYHEYWTESVWSLPGGDTETPPS